MKLNFTVCSSRRHSSRPAANVAMYIERLNWCCSTKSRHIDKRMWMKWNKYLRYQLEICDFNFNSQCTRFKFSHLIFIQFGWCNRKWQKGKMENEFVFIFVLREYFIYSFIHSYFSSYTKNRAKMILLWMLKKCFSGSQSFIHPFPGI